MRTPLVGSCLNRLPFKSDLRTPPVGPDPSPTGYVDKKRVARPLRQPKGCLFHLSDKIKMQFSTTGNDGASSTSRKLATHRAWMSDERPLPANIEVERLILGSILLNGKCFGQIVASLVADDFALEKHKCIFRRMSDLYERNESIDRVTIANELRRHAELESIDGLGYLVSLDEGMPQLANVEAYVRILREKASLRRIIGAAESMANRALLEVESPAEIIAGMEFVLAEIRSASKRSAAIESLPAVGEVEEPVVYVRNPELPEGAIVALTGDSGSGKSTLATAWARDAIATGRAVLILDRENPRSVVFDRMQRLGLRDGPLLRWHGGWTGRDESGPGEPEVFDWVRTASPKPLIIVDSFSAFLNGNENSAGDIRRFMNLCRRLADLGACVLNIHHDGKSETSKDFRGSTDFKAAIDQAFHVRNVSSSLQLDQIQLRCFKSRYGFCGEITYRYDQGKLSHYRPCKASGPSTADRLTELLRANPDVTSSAFEKLALSRGVKRNKARQFLADGISTQAIQKRIGEKNSCLHRLNVPMECAPPAGEHVAQSVNETDHIHPSSIKS